MQPLRPGPVRALLLVAILLAPALPASAQDPPSLPGVDLSPLSPAQQQTAMKIFQQNRCTCGCGMTIVDCRTKDPNCTRSPALAAQVVQLLAQGKPEAEVVKTVFATPTAAPARPAAAAPQQEMEFAVPVGDEVFALGPEGAPVTLVTWLDYQ